MGAEESRHCDPRGQPVPQRPRRTPRGLRAPRRRLAGRAARPRRPLRHRPAHPPAACPRARRPRLGWSLGRRRAGRGVRAAGCGCARTSCSATRRARSGPGGASTTGPRAGCCSSTSSSATCPTSIADACSELLFAWADEQARAVGRARGLDGPADRHRRVRRRRPAARAGSRRPASSRCAPGCR